MITHDEALKFINEKLENKNIVKHMLAAEVLMAGIYEVLQNKGTVDLGGTKEEWMMAGLLHDADYCPAVPENLQGVMVCQWLEERGFPLPANVRQTMAAHNRHATGVEPQSLMDWALFCGDSLTGLIVATALVMPDKKLGNVKFKSVLKKFNDPSFARGTRRDDILMSEEKLGLTLEEFIKVGLESMQKISPDLGL